MKRVLVFLLVIVMLLAAVACGNGNSDTPDASASQSGGAPASTSPSSSGQASTQPSGQTGGDASAPGTSGAERSRSVTLGNNGKPASLNILRVANNSGYQLYNEFMYDALIYSRHTGTGYDPMLATSWESNADASVWTFHLREGVTFHNDAPFDADDVVCTYQNLIDLGSDSPPFVAHYSSLQTVKKIDQYTVEFTFSKSFPLALDSFRKTFIFNNEAFEELGEAIFDWEHCYGTGPWKMAEWKDGEYTRLVKYDSYWNKANYDSYFNEVILNHVGEPAALVAAHLAGDIHLYAPASGMNLDLISLYDSVADRVELARVPIASIDYLTIQCGEGHLGDDINFRKALSYAIDRELIYGALFNGLGRASIGFFAEGAPVHNPNNTNYTYDPELAKQYLAQSSYDGRTLKYIVRAVVTKLNTQALAIADMLDAVGIKVEVEPLESMLYTERTVAEDYDIIMSSSPLSDFLPATFFNNILNDTAHTNFRDPQLLGLIDNYLSELDDAKRIEIGRQVGDLMSELYAPFIGIGHPFAVYAYDKGLTGINFFSDGDNNLCYIDYDPSLAS